MVRIKTRYERAVVPVRQTLEQLNNYAPFQEVVKKLRSEHWKDWHLLMAISQIAINYRTGELGHKDRKEAKELFFEEMDKEESKESILVPLLEFSEEAIRAALSISLLSTLKGMGLELKTVTPNVEAIQHFFSKRLNYWDHDIEHDRIFDA